MGGQGTFGMDDSHAADNNDSKLHIIEASKGFQHVTDHQLDLLHINCEGCEYELLENIIENNLHRKIKIIQFGSHFFAQIARLTERYCNIREKLSETHVKIYGQSFGWERWDSKLV